MSLSGGSEAMRHEQERITVLCVDLDGALLATDALWESVLLCMKQQPWACVQLPLWLLKGKAYVKRQLALRVHFDATYLPYREDVLRFLHQQKASGRTLILVTASDEEMARPIAEHVGIFADVMASDGAVNLSGPNKRTALVKRFGSRGFDYLGDGAVDLPVWESANAALLVGPSKALLNRVKAVTVIQHIFSARRNGGLPMLSALRPSQWVKNILVFVPLVTAHRITDTACLIQAFSAFAACSGCASSVYLMNDLLDLSADRRHATKQHRPFAAGTLSIPTGLCLIPLLLLGAFALAWRTLPAVFTTVLAVYLVTATAYSLRFKHIMVVDVMLLASLYVLRIYAGAVAVDIPVSTWLLAFAMFLFLSLAFVKRYAELNTLQAGRDQVEGRDYLSADKEWIRSVGAASGYLSVLVLALYINSKEVMVLYRHPERLWFVCPLLLYWITRMWCLVHRGHLDDDPVVAAVKDPLSYMAGALIAIILVMAS